MLMPFLSLLSQAARRAMQGAATLLVAASVAAAPATPQAVVSDAARAFVESRSEHEGLVEPQVELRVVAQGRGASGSCPAGWAAQTLDTRSLSRMRFAAVCPGTPNARQEFVVNATVSAMVVVAQADVPAGRELQAADLTLDRRDVTHTPDAVSDTEAVLGQASRRALRQGQVVLRPWLLAPTLVKRGDAVQIVAGADPVRVSTAGEALETGRRNEVVRVRNVTTGRIVRARVVDAGVVEPIEASMPQSPR
jgi:flagella basal body P-ring formation protein FlgA